MDSLVVMSVLLASTIIFVSTQDRVEVIVDSQFSTNNCSCWEDEQKQSITIYCCGTLDLGMNVLQNVKHQEGMKLLVIARGNYSFTSNHTGHFNNVKSITIQGSPISLSTVACSEGVGLSFINSTDIAIRRLKFVHCGQLQNSTSVNQTTNMFIKTIVTMYFLHCKNIDVINSNFSDTKGISLVFYNVVGRNTIESCLFERNQFVSEGTPGGGGVYIEYSYCDPNGNAVNKCTNNDSDIQSFLHNGSFLLKDCHFIQNYGNISMHEWAYKYIFKVPNDKTHCALGNGGGVSLYLMGNASENSINIMNCEFRGNVGLWGGGLMIQIQDAANNNFITVSDSHFANNSVLYSNADGTGGGGSRLAIFLHSEGYANNTIIYSNCTFRQNKAYYGGGFSFYSDIWNDENKVELNGCTFDGNAARIGSATDFTIMQWIDKEGNNSEKIVIPHVGITNCNFTNNNYAISNGFIGLGAVNLNSINLVVNGYANFIGNSDSALALASSKFTVSINSTVTFSRNKGRNGGAMALFGKVAIIVEKNSKFEFSENNAEYLGGAIYHTSWGIYDLVYSHDCFLHFEEEGKENNWTTASFHFRDNTANGHANSIYIPTLSPCLHDLSFGSYHNKDLFCDNETWIYSHNNKSESCTTQVATAPTSIDVQDSSNISYIPGNLPIHIGYTIRTNAGQATASENTLIANIINISEVRLVDNPKGHFSYISNNNLYLLGREDTKVTLSLETIDPIAVRKDVTIRFKNCPPGFIFNETTFKCECAGTYVHQVFCDQVRYEARIARTSWMGQYPQGTSNNTTLLVGFSPYVMKLTSNEQILLPDTSEKLDECFCGRLNRTGTLCGNCKPGYGVTVNTNDYDCIKCDQKAQQINWIYYILSEFVPVTIFFISVFLFSMRITHGPLNSFVFFAQTVTTVIQMDAQGLTPIEGTIKDFQTFRNIYMIPYDFWNLNFFRSLLPRFCLSPHLGTLSVLMLGYLTALYPLLLILLFMVILNLYNRSVKPIVILVRPIHCCLARFSQLTNLRQSITAGIGVFILMSYNKFATVSFNLIPFYHLFDAEGRKVVVVFYHQGTKVFPDEGIGYFLMAIFVLCTFGIIPPAILAYPSFLKLLERLKFLRSCRLMAERYYPGHKFQAFLDEFHGCYRSNNGTDCRWFASLYLVLRISLSLMFSQVNTWQELYIMQSITFLACALLFAIIRPYREDWINNVDTCIFAILSAVSTLSLYNLQLAMIRQKISTSAFYLQFILIMAPMVYCLLYYSFLIYKWGKEKCLCSCNNGSHLDDDEETGLEDSTYLARFFDFVKASGRYHRQPLNAGASMVNSNLQNYGSMNFDNSG